MHNGPFDEPDSFGIPIFQAKVTKIGTDVGLNILINTGPGYFQNHQKIIFSQFPTWHMEKSPLALSSS